jgi:hypothetical protein
MSDKRYEKYPNIARSLRAMTDEGRGVVAHWHRVLTTALEGYKAHVVEEARQVATTPEERLAATMAAEAAVAGWLNTMREVAGIIVDPSVGDWCCKPGMLASPTPCPQHGWRLEEDYPLGTVIARPDAVYGEERAVVVANGSVGVVWVSVEYGVEYQRENLVDGGWVVVARV